MEVSDLVRMQLNNKGGELKHLKTFFRTSTSCIYIYVNNNTLIFSSIKASLDGVIQNRQSAYIPSDIVMCALDSPHMRGVFTIKLAVLRAIEWESKMFHTLAFGSDTLTHILSERDVSVTKKYPLESASVDWDSPIKLRTRVVGLPPKYPTVVASAAQIRATMCDIKKLSPDTLIYITYSGHAELLSINSADGSLKTDIKCVDSPHNITITGIMPAEHVFDGLLPVKAKHTNAQQAVLVFTPEALYIQVKYIHDPFWQIATMSRFVEYNISPPARGRMDKK